MKKLKIKIHKPISVKEAIDDLQTFLECDLYSKFRPEHKIKGEMYYREDTFPNEKEFWKYLNDHFNILKKQIIKLIGKKEFENKKPKKTYLKCRINKKKN